MSLKKIDLTPQVNHPGLWVSKVLQNRYQILESQLTRGQYYIYDLVEDDLLRNRDHSCRYFPNKAAAMAVIAPVEPKKPKKPKKRKSRFE